MSSKWIEVAGRRVGRGQPCFVIAEIGINHNGDLQIACDLIDAAAAAGCDAVKFQKRTPELCVPESEWNTRRATPWGEMSYLEYRHRVELDESAFAVIDARCRQAGILWMASCWDRKALDQMAAFDPPCFKIASASLTDDELLRAYRATRKPLMLSTGMSTLEQIDHAVEVLGSEDLALLQCTSTYPTRNDELNLRVIPALEERYGLPIGYSGHELGLQATLAAVAFGACVIERHITLDRAMWGSDQAASVEPGGFQRLVRDIRIVEIAAGDGVKRVYDSEIPIARKLRRVG